MFLNCDGWKNFGYDEENYHGTTDCGPYFSDGTPKPTNKFAMKEWSHDRAHYKINKDMNLDPHGMKVPSSLSFKLSESLIAKPNSMNLEK